MFSNIKVKPLLVGLSFFAINLFVYYVKISNPNYNMIANRADLMDGYFGFFLLIIFFILSLSILSYGISLDNKFSRVGEYMYNIFLKVWSDPKL